jgi:hypothetical protein
MWNTPAVEQLEEEDNGHTQKAMAARGQTRATTLSIGANYDMAVMESQLLVAHIFLTSAAENP